MNWFIQTKVFKVITAILLCWGSMVQCMGWLSRGTALEVILWTSAHRGKVIPSSTVAAHHTGLFAGEFLRLCRSFAPQNPHDLEPRCSNDECWRWSWPWRPAPFPWLRELLRVKPLRPGLELKCTCSSVCLASMTFALVIIAASQALALLTTSARVTVVPSSFLWRRNSARSLSSLTPVTKRSLMSSSSGLFIELYSQRRPWYLHRASNSAMVSWGFCLQVSRNVILSARTVSCPE